MLDKKEIKNLDTQIDNALSTMSLTKEEQAILSKIIGAKDKEELQVQFDSFNLNQSKKNALRIAKLSNLLEKVEDQAIERFEKRPDQVSNKELLDYMQVISNQIQRSQGVVDSLTDKPMISIKEDTTEVNINVAPSIDREGKERVVDAVNALLKQLKKPSITSTENIIEAEVLEKDEDSDVEILYNQENE